MTLQRDALHGGISRLLQTGGMVYKDFALVTDYGYGVFLLWMFENKIIYKLCGSGSSKILPQAARSHLDGMRSGA